MCGRYLFSTEQNTELKQVVKAVEYRYGRGRVKQGEIRPSTVMPVLRLEGGKPLAELQVWGYRLPTSLIINARAESVMEKQLFRNSIRNHRCIIPSSGFYEWDSEKHKYFFSHGQNQVMYLAGLTLMQDGIPHYCIITTAANDSVQIVHNRMPLVLSREQASGWMRDLSTAQELLQFVPSVLQRENADTQLRFL